MATPGQLHGRLRAGSHGRRHRINDLDSTQKIRWAVGCLGVLVFVAFALWPLSVQYPHTWTDYGRFTLPSEEPSPDITRHEIRHASCGAPILATGKKHCGDEAKNRLMTGGILGGLLIAGGIFLVPLLVDDGRRKSSTRTAPTPSSGPTSADPQSLQPGYGGEFIPLGHSPTALDDQSSQPWHQLTIIATVISAVSLVIVDVGIIAMILGIVAIVQIRKADPQPRGLGLAWTAAVLGGLLWFGPVLRPRRRSDAVQSASRTSIPAALGLLSSELRLAEVDPALVVRGRDPGVDERRRADAGTRTKNDRSSENRGPSGGRRWSNHRSP